MTLPKDLPHSPDSDHRFRAAEAFHLGDALITPSLNRIEIHATAHQIEPKVMKVLLTLCARPGHVVYRDQILQPVWGHTGDDYLLNRAISELRKIFGDSAHKPAYIETIRKTGYRLVAPIKPAASAALVVDNPATSNTSKWENGLPESNPGPDQPLSAPTGSVSALSESAALQTSAEHKPSNKKIWVPGAIGVLGICAVLLFLLVQTRWLATSKPFSLDHYQVYPATHFAGHEYDAALSPDGSRIVYVAAQPEKPGEIFIKMLEGEQALQLSQAQTESQIEDRAEGQMSSPQWMPDGQSIIYLDLAAPELRFMSVSPMGGPSRMLHRDSEAFGVRGMSIANDGGQLVYAKRSAPDGPHQLWLFSLAKGERIPLTTPAPGLLGDVDPLFAPDGKSVVFVRGSDEVTKDIYRLDLTDKNLTRLTHDNRKINGVAWSPDGARLLFTSTRSGIYGLWSMDRDGGDPQPLSLGWESAQQPTTVVGVQAIVFEDWRHMAKLVSVDLVKGAGLPPQPLKVSLRWDSNPSISPDGKTLVFASNRGGPFGIWQSELKSDQGGLEGDVAYQWAQLDGAFIDNPTWSPDGRQIVFDASPTGRTRLYLLDKGASIAQPLALGESDNRTPSWSRDSQWIYFESNRSGTWQIYAWRVGSAEVRPIAAADGRNPQESADGHWLLFAAGDGIWRCRKADCLAGNAAADKAELLISGIAGDDIYNWSPARDGIYFIRRPEARPEVAFLRYADGTTTGVSPLARNFLGWGMTLTADESRLYFTEMTQQGADIKIARP